MPCFIHYQHPEPPESATFPSTTLFRSWGSCLHGYSENIAINTSATVESAIEWAIFSIMYDDQACRSEEHTSELQSRGHLVCRLPLEKKTETVKAVLFPT